MIADVPEHDAFERLLDAAEALSGLPLREIESSGSPDDLADTRVAQPLLYLVDWAWGQALLDSGLEPDFVAGHSLGEFAALATAGVFSVEAGLELVVERSRLMAHAAAASPGAMSAVIGLDRAAIAAVLADGRDVWVANDNAPGQTIISGTREGVSRAASELDEAGARRIIPLKVAGAFHSPLMQSAGDAFTAILADTEFANAHTPVLQNTDPTPETDAEDIRSRLSTQMTSPVRWTETMETLAASAPLVMIEAGPGSVLTGMAKRVEGVSAVSAEVVGVETALMEVN
jgi:[acyl-carrier-protein] S-malonyltransferase